MQYLSNVFNTGFNAIRNGANAVYEAISYFSTGSLGGRLVNQLPQPEPKMENVHENINNLNEVERAASDESNKSIISQLKQTESELDIDLDKVLKELEIEFKDVHEQVDELYNLEKNEQRSESEINKDFEELTKEFEKTTNKNEFGQDAILDAMGTKTSAKEQAELEKELEELQRGLENTEKDVDV